MKKAMYFIFLFFSFFLVTSCESSNSVEKKVELIQEVQNEFLKYKEKNNISMNIELEKEINKNVEKISKNIKSINKPVYLEIEDNVKQETAIFQEENQKIFAYTFPISSNMSSEKIQMKRTYDGLNIGHNALELDLKELVNSLALFKMNAKNIELKKKNSAYQLQFQVVDVKDKDIQASLVEVISKLGDVEDPEHIQWDIVIHCDSSTSFSLDIKTKFNYINLEHVLLKGKISFDFNDITKLDLSDSSKYQVLNKTIEEKEHLRTELNSAITDFLKNDNSSIEITSKMTSKLKDNQGNLLSTEEREQILRQSISPLYIDQWDSYSGQTTIVQEENGKLICYDIPRPYDLDQPVFVKRILLGFLEDIDDVPLFEVGPIFTMDVSLFEISQNGSKYFIEVDLADVASVLKEEFSDIFVGLDEYLQYLPSSYLIYEFDLQNTFNIQYRIEMAIKNFSEWYSITFSNSIELISKEFEKINLKDTSKYIVPNPTSIDEVTEISEINSPLDLKIGGYYAFYFEPGQYAITSENNNDIYLKDTKLYNQEHQELPMGIGVDVLLNGFDKSVFSIEEKGIYYLYLRSGIEDKYSIKKVEYKNNSTITQPMSLKDSVGNIEGKYDFHCYNYICNLDEGILVIENQNDQPLYMIEPEYRYDSSLENFTIYYVLKKVEKSIYIKLKKGDNYIWICSSPEDSIYSYSYNFSVREVDLLNGYEKNYEDLDILTDDFSSKTYVAGLALLKEPRLALEVTKSGYYSFDLDYLDDEMLAYISVKTKDGENVYAKTEYYYLDPGKYIVSLQQNDYNFAICRIKYQMIENKDN